MTYSDEGLPADEVGEWRIEITTPNGGCVRRVIPAVRAPGYGCETYELLRAGGEGMAFLAVIQQAQREAVMSHGIDPDDNSPELRIGGRAVRICGG